MTRGETAESSACAGQAAAQTAPTITGLTTNSPASGDTFGAGETITATLTFSQIISGGTGGGTPVLKVQIGSVTRDVLCTNCSNAGTSRDFSYTVQASDSDPDGISIRDGALVGGVFSSFVYGLLDRTISSTLEIVNSASRKVDGSRLGAGVSAVTGVSLNTPVLGGTFERGEAIEATVTFNTAVDVTGTPQVGLGIGSNTRQASYVSGTGTTSLLFRYTVVTADVDSNGLSIAADALGLNSGTINTAGSTTNTLLGLGAYAISDSANHQVNGGTFNAAAVSGVSITSTPAEGDTYYRLGEAIWVTVTFNRAVTVVTTGGIPQLALTVGSNTRQSALSDVPGMGRLIFSYTVAAGDFDDDGITIAAGALALNGGQINDARAATTAASLGLGTHAIADDADHKVATPPIVLAANGIAVNTPGAGSTFERLERIEVTVNFNRAVDVTGTPQVGLGIGSNTRQADYVSGSGSTALLFRYTVVQADTDSNGISIAATALALNGGTIRGSAADRTDASLGLGGNAGEFEGAAGGELGFTHLGTGLSVEARARTLLAHQAEDYREWGAGFAVRLQPGRDRGGLSLSLAPSWGEAAGGAGALWGAEGGLGGFGPHASGQGLTDVPDAPGLSPDALAMELGWGVALPGGGEFTPFGRWSREGLGGHRLNAGTRWSVLRPPAPGRARAGRLTLPRGLRLMVDLFAEQFADVARPTDRRLVLLGRVGF